MKAAAQKTTKYDRIDTSVKIDPSERMAEQSHKRACDVNCILAKYQKTGVIDHVKTHGPQYMDVPAIDYREAMEIVASSNSMFEELPARARDYFDNSPEKFLTYVQDPQTDYTKLHELGLLDPQYVPQNATEEHTETSEGSSATSKSGESDAEASEEG